MQAALYFFVLCRLLSNDSYSISDKKKTSQDRLANYVFSNNNIYLIEKYESLLIESYSELVLGAYANVLNRNIIIIPSDSMDKKAHFTRPIFIINKNGLHHLVTDLKKMFLEFYKYDVKSISNDTIFEIIAHHNFAKEDFLDRYSIMI